MRFHFKYKNYPLSSELTQKSKRVGTLTHPIYGFMLAGILGLLGVAIFPDAVTLPMILILGGAVVFPILLLMYRKKKFAQYDAEYAQLLKNQGR